MLRVGDIVKLKGSKQLLYVLSVDDATKTISVWYYKQDKENFGPGTASGIHWLCTDFENSAKQERYSYEPGNLCTLWCLEKSHVFVVNGTVSPFAPPMTMVELVTFNHEGDLVNFKAPLCAIKYLKSLDDLRDA